MVVVGEGCLYLPTIIRSCLITPVWIDHLDIQHYIPFITREGGIDFEVKRSSVKVTSQRCLHLPTNSFLDGNSCLDKSIAFQPHTCITHQSGKTSIDFRVKRSKTKFACKGWAQICFWTITSVKINKLFPNFTKLSPIAQKKSFLILYY